MTPPSPSNDGDTPSEAIDAYFVDSQRKELTELCQEMSRL